MVCWGLMSTARINNRIIPSIPVSKRRTLIAAASRDRTRSIKYTEQWKIPHAFGSYSSMLDSELIDVVYISLPITFIRSRQSVCPQNLWDKKE